MGRTQREKAGRTDRPRAEANAPPVYLPDANPPTKRPLLFAIAATAFALWLAFLAWLAITQ